MLDRQTDRQIDRQTVRNGELDFLRIIFAIIVFGYHVEYGFNVFKSGYLAVEFFFIVSGYFLMMHLEKEKLTKQRITFKILQYIKKRLFRLYFSYAFVCIIAYLIRCFILNQISVKTIFDQGVWELLLLQAIGFRFSTTVLWYVSALILSSVLIYLLYYGLRDYFFSIAFFVSLTLLALLYQNNQRLSLLGNLLVVSDGLLRGLSEMLLGCFVYKIVQFFSKREYKFKKYLFIPKIIILILLLYNMTREPGIKDFSSLLLCIMLVVLLFLDNSSFHKLFNNKICYYLGSISYDFYLNQVIIIYLSRIIPDDILGAYPVLTFICFIIAGFLLSLITMTFSKAINKKFNK